MPSDPRSSTLAALTGFDWAALGEHLGSDLGDFDHHVRRQIGSPRGDADRLGIRRLVEAIGLSLVGTEEREQPPDPFLIVDADDVVGDVLGRLDLLGKISLYQKARHDILLCWAKSTAEQSNLLLLGRNDDPVSEPPCVSA